MHRSYTIQSHAYLGLSSLALWLHLVRDLVNNFGDWASVTGMIMRRTDGEGERPRLWPRWLARKSASAEEDRGFLARRNRSGVLKNFLFSSAKETNLGFLRVDPAGQRRWTIRAACSFVICKGIFLMMKMLILESFNWQMGCEVVTPYLV